MEEIIIYDIYDLWYHPFWYQLWFKIVLVLLGAVIVGICLWKLIKQQWMKPPLKPWQEAMNRLAGLNAQVRNDQTSKQALYQQLTDTIKNYFSTRYNLRLRGKTDEEVMVIVRATEVPAEVVPRLTSVLEHAVAVKFAHEAITPEQIHADIADLSQCILMTIPAENIQKKTPPP